MISFGAILADATPAHDEWGWIADVLNWMNAHLPYFPIFACLLIAACLIIIAHGYAKKWHADAELRERAEDAEKAQHLAEDALQIANTDNERLRLILQVIANNLTRRDRIYHGTPTDEPEPKSSDGLRNLCEWIPQVLKLERADLNKITVWRPTEDDSALVVAEFNAMNPESARKITLPIRPATTDRDTFAAMAYRNGRIEVCSDTETDERYSRLRNVPPTHPYRSIIAVPILRGGRVVGVYTIDSREPGRFTKTDEASLQQYELWAQLFALFLTLTPETAPPTGDGLSEGKDLPSIQPPP